MLQHRNSFHITGPFHLAAPSHYWIQQIIIVNRPILTNPTVHLSNIPQSTIQNRNVYISVLSGALLDMGQVHCGICEIGLLDHQERSSLNFYWAPNYVHTGKCINVICKMSAILPLTIILLKMLTHWGRVTHICVSKLTIIGSDNGLSPGRRQTIIWTNDGILLIRPLGTNFSEILIAIYTFSFEKMHLKMSSGKWRPSCLGLNVLTVQIRHLVTHTVSI